MSFVHLHVHTEYSKEAISKIRHLFNRASELKMPGLAITDQGNISGVPEFFRTADRFPDVKPIAGCEFLITDSAFRHKYYLILLAKNLSGYKNLVKLVSYAHTKGKLDEPCITRKVLTNHFEGLICISACKGGEISQAILEGDMAGAATHAEFYKRLFGDDFYLEVSLHRNTGSMKLALVDDRKSYLKQSRELFKMQKRANDGIFQIAEELGIKVVATNDVHFVERNDGIAHDAKLAIIYGKKVADKDRLRYSHLEYLKTEDEMRRLFPEHSEVIDNTLEVLEKVERYSILQQVELPKISDRPDAELREKVYLGAQSRFGELCKEQRERLEFELEIIVSKGVSGYFLIVKDLVDWVREKGWVVGPGSGSAAGSLVNYCLGITEINPLKHSLLFERFYSPECISLPEISIDLEPAAAAQIQEYFKNRYGKECIAGITAFGKFRPRDALKEVGWTMGLSADSVDRVCREIDYDWNDPFWKLEIENNAVVRHAYENGSEAFRDAYNAAIRLSGVIVDEGVHPCGWLVTPSAIGEILPVQIQEGQIEGDYTLKAMYEAMCAKDMVLKLNTPSLNDLAVIRNALSAIEQNEGNLIDPNELPLDDEPTLALFAKGDTLGIFQFNSEGIRDRMKIMNPKSFDDLVAMEALYRPELMELIPEFIESAKSAKHFVIDFLDWVLADTHGLLIYQEQMMLLAKQIAGFSPAAADKLRKAVGKRQSSILKNFHNKFIEGGKSVCESEQVLELIWSIIIRTYPFNKSHAVCYTWISYQEAWIKAHYPKEFYKAFLGVWGSRVLDTDDIIADAARHQIYFILPDKSRSGEWEVLE